MNRLVLILAMLLLSASCFASPKIAYRTKPADWNEPEYIEKMLDQKEQDWGLHRGMAHCQAYVESRFHPTAISPDGNDRGLFQVNKIWEPHLVWRYFRTPSGEQRTGFDWRNPEHSATVGCAYLADMTRVYGGSNWLGLVAYNWGPGNLSSVKRWEDIPAKKRKYANDTLALLDGLTMGGWK